MILINITLPVRYNNGETISEKRFEDIEKEFLQEFNGFSKYPIKGRWVSPSGKIYQDDNWKYEIIIAEEDHAETRDYLVNLKKKLKKELKQLELLFTMNKIDIIE